MGSRIAHIGRVEGYAIISEDGMLADAAGIMPASLKFDADQRFFEHGLDRAMWWYMDATPMSGSHYRICDAA